MDQSQEPLSFAGVVAIMALGVTIVAALTGGVGWTASLILPLTLAQCIFITTGSFVVAILAWSASHEDSVFGQILLSLIVSLVATILIALLAWPTDAFTSLSRWEATLHLFAVFNSLAFLVIRQAVTEQNWRWPFVGGPVMIDDPPTIDVLRGEPRVSKARGRRRKRVG